MQKISHSFSSNVYVKVNFLDVIYGLVWGSIPQPFVLPLLYCKFIWTNFPAVYMYSLTV